jgi:hypothetical protein
MLFLTDTSQGIIGCFLPLNIRIMKTCMKWQIRMPALPMIIITGLTTAAIICSPQIELSQQAENDQGDGIKTGKIRG